MALIVALTGGAFAANGALTAKQKKEVKAIAKQFAGKPGAQGPKGPRGPAGAAGAKGEKGNLGEKGKGTDGAAGKNVEVRPADAGNVVECEENGGGPAPVMVHLENPFLSSNCYVGPLARRSSGS